MKKLKLLSSIAFRNLIRQRRRNILLGVAIAFGTMILVLANSFSRGITDTLLNKVVVQMTGHIELAVLERSRSQNLLLRDKATYIKLLKDNLPEIRDIAENVAVFSRAIGHGKGENVIIVPTDLGDGQNLTRNIDADYILSRTTEGKIADLTSPQYENPIAIFSDKAKALGVKLFDTIKVRLKTVNGQEQSARFTIVVVMRSESLFESGAIFLPLKNLKELRAIRDNETGSLQVTFNKFDSPRAVIQMADKIHALLKPGTAMISGELKLGKKLAPAKLGGLNQEFAKATAFQKSFQLKSGALFRDKDTDQILLSEPTARALGARVKSKVTLNYKSIHSADPIEYTFNVAGIIAGPTFDAFLPEAGFYRVYLSDLPAERVTPTAPTGDLATVFAPEFKVLPRTSTGDDLQKKNQDLRKTNFYGPAMDVRTMYESASQVLDLERAMNMITAVAVVILFFIILIGVINTLRMTIRERTREIGTMRAMGVQRGDVRNIFLLETFQLTLFSAVAGLILAFGAMTALSAITIDTQSVLGIFLSKKHLYFLPLLTDIIKNLVIIMIIATGTAFFPAHRAAKLDAAEALRHYE